MDDVMTYKMPVQFDAKTRLYASQAFQDQDIIMGKDVFDIFLESVEGQNLTPDALILAWTKLFLLPEVISDHNPVELEAIDRHFNLVISCVIDDEPFRNLCIAEMEAVREEARQGKETGF